MHYLRTLQLCRMSAADGAGGSAGTAAPTAEGDAAKGKPSAGAEGKPDAATETPKTYTEAELQAEIDRVAGKVRSEEQKKNEKAIRDARTEGERFAKLSEDERRAAEEKEREEKVAAREEAVSRRELQANALVELGKRGLPVELADALVYTTAEALDASLKAVEKAFRAAVQKDVEDRMKGKEAPKAGGGAAAAPKTYSQAIAAGLKEQTGGK